jgi:hypothetical protein
MGKYTAWEDPLPDRIVEDHMRRIVEAIRSRLEPQAISLRGSFGRGEGGVVLENGRARFLSDYDINVVTHSSRHRALLERLSRELTRELEVETNLFWKPPDHLQEHRGDLARYEARYGSRTIHGRELPVRDGPWKPSDIPLHSPLVMMIHRMADAMAHIPDGSGDDMIRLFWVTKSVIVCAGSLLLLWEKYHHSYGERAARFASLAPERIDFMGEEGPAFTRYVARAAEFKLRPRRDLYPESVSDAWREVIPGCVAVFRHFAKEGLKFPLPSLVDFPAAYLQHVQGLLENAGPMQFWKSKASNLRKFLGQGRLPRGILSPHLASSVVYSVIPVVFGATVLEDDDLARANDVTRKVLRKAWRLDRPRPDSRAEWNHLREQTYSAWYALCH